MCSCVLRVAWQLPSTMDDEKPAKERQATCIEVLIFLIWYSFVMVLIAAVVEQLRVLSQVMVLGQYMDSGYDISLTLRGNS